MTKVYERLQRCLKSIEDKIPFRPRLALVLGSGLGDYAERIEIEASIDYHEITDFPVSTVSGHKGRFVFGHIGSVPVVIMQGRVHFYEGYSIEDVVLPERLMHLMGAEILFLTNACGSANPAYQAGDFMLITDHAYKESVLNTAVSGTLLILPEDAVKLHQRDKKTHALLVKVP